MEKHSIVIYIMIMIFMTNIIRVIPVTLIKGRIRNTFIRSFLYYVPYVTLAVMTFPAIMETTTSRISGLAALVLGIIAAWRGWGLFPVAILCCIVALATNFM